MAPDEHVGKLFDKIEAGEDDTQKMKAAGTNTQIARSKSGEYIPVDQAFREFNILANLILHKHGFAVRPQEVLEKVLHLKGEMQPEFSKVLEHFFYITGDVSQRDLDEVILKLDEGLYDVSGKPRPLNLDPAQSQELSVRNSKIAHLVSEGDIGQARELAGDNSLLQSLILVYSTQADEKGRETLDLLNTKNELENTQTNLRITQTQLRQYRWSTRLGLAALLVGSVSAFMYDVGLKDRQLGIEYQQPGEGDESLARLREEHSAKIVQLSQSYQDEIHEIETEKQKKLQALQALKNEIAGYRRELSDLRSRVPKDDQSAHKVLIFRLMKNLNQSNADFDLANRNDPVDHSTYVNELYSALSTHRNGAHYNGDDSLIDDAEMVLRSSLVPVTKQYEAEQNDIKNDVNTAYEKAVADAGSLSRREERKLARKFVVIRRERLKECQKKFEKEYGPAFEDIVLGE